MPTDKLKIYFTTIGCVVVFTRVSLMFALAPLLAELLIPKTTTLVHEKFVPIVVLLVAV